MSTQPMNSNLVRNGNFAHRELYWNATATAPGRVDFSRQKCVITGPGRAEQDISVSDTAPYTFSLYTLITYNGAGSVRLIWQPSGTTETITLTGNHGWTHHLSTFSPPADTTGLTLQLMGDAGDVWFDSLQLAEDDGVVIPVELIRNGDFADNSDHWIANEPEGSSSVTFFGNECQANLGGSIEQEIAVTPGQTYAFSIDARTPTGGHGFAIFHIAPGNTPQIELRGGGDWDTYTSSLTIPASVTEITLEVIGTTFLVVDNLSLKLAPVPAINQNRPHLTHMYRPSQENRTMSNANARKAARQESAERFFQGSIGSENFKADFRKHELKNNFWFAEGAMKIPPTETSRQVVIFKYPVNAVSGRYVLEKDPDVHKLAVILMTINETPTPAYQAHRGIVEFFHDSDDQTVTGALDVYLMDINNQELRMQMLFSLDRTSRRSPTRINTVQPR
ncbi:hypothetical protein [Pseudomonas fluorescens]|uniref:hypothetical protein n=1 Tax=Pseudomonas fluorescens TaxID=294 RepID=UPI0009375129|nr:hypothetical protein [Pseudomonas fluorescens]